MARGSERGLMQGDLTRVLIGDAWGPEGVLQGVPGDPKGSWGLQGDSKGVTLRDARGSQRVIRRKA